MSAAVAPELLQLSWLASPAATASYLSGGQWRRSAHVDYLSRKLRECVQKPGGRLAIMLPPRHGKSEMVSHYLPAWFLGRWPDGRVILTSYEADFAAQWGRKARNEIEQNESLFSQVGLKIQKDSHAAQRWETTAGGSMQTAGVGGPITGKGADLAIIDDAVKNFEEAQSPTYRTRTWEWYRSTLYTRLHPDASIVILMTRWHQDDLLGMILQHSSEDWDVVRLPALAEDHDDPLGREPGEALWPEQYPVERLETIKQEVGSYVWAGLYQQRPAPLEGGIFKRDWLRYAKRDGEHYDLDGRRYELGTCTRFATVDLAVSTKTSADYTVIAVWDLTPDNDLILIALYRERMEAADHDKAIEQAFRAYTPGYIGIESVAYQLALVQNLRRKGLPVVELKADRDKLSRALPAAAMMEGGKVWFMAGASWLPEVEDEILAFPNAAHDDVVDVLGFAALEVGSRAVATPDMIADEDDPLKRENPWSV